jgi:hypothetical protein
MMMVLWCINCSNASVLFDMVPPDQQPGLQARQRFLCIYHTAFTLEYPKKYILGQNVRVTTINRARGRMGIRIEHFKNYNSILTVTELPIVQIKFSM